MLVVCNDDDLLVDTPTLGLTSFDMIVGVGIELAVVDIVDKEAVDDDEDEYF